MAVQQATIVGIGSTLADIEQSVVQQARSLAGEEWSVHHISLGKIAAYESDDIYTDTGTCRMVRVWEASATVTLTSGNDRVDAPRDFP